MVRTMRVSCPIRPAIEAILITRPQRAGIIDLRPMCWVSTKTPVRLRFTSLSQASSGCSSAGAPPGAPALFTRVSMRLNLASTASAIGAVASRLPRSHTHASQSMLRVRRCATASSSSFFLRALMAMVAPISPSASASCSPSPREPPVTSARRPFKSSSCLTVATLAELMPWAMLIEFLPLMTTLVMFSGGLDSTAMLVQLLTQSREELRVHHVRMENREQRAAAEQSAVERIVAWCASRYRPVAAAARGRGWREPLPAVSLLAVGARFPRPRGDPDRLPVHRFRRVPGGDRHPRLQPHRRGGACAGHRHREPLGAPAARVRDALRVLPSAQARRAEGRMDLSGLWRGQARARQNA